MDRFADNNLPTDREAFLPLPLASYIPSLPEKVALMKTSSQTAVYEAAKSLNEVVKIQMKQT